jgi:hypothetical protein
MADPRGHWEDGGRVWVSDGEMPPAEIRPNEGALVDDHGRCEDTDEVVGHGSLHVEQMHDKCFCARLELPDGKAIVMWFQSRGKIKLVAEWD